MLNLTFAIMKGEKQQTTDILIITVFPSKEIRFSKLQGGIPQYSTIEGLKLNPSGILKEFPDLKEKPLFEMKKIAIERFKKHIKSLKTMEEIKHYLKEDLQKHGYKLVMSQRKGFRPIKEC